MNISEVKISTFVHRSCVLCGMDSVTSDQPHLFSCGFLKSSEVLHRSLVFGAVACSFLLFAEIIYLLRSLCICVYLCRWKISVLGIRLKTAITSFCKLCFASVAFLIFTWCQFYWKYGHICWIDLAYYTRSYFSLDVVIINLKCCCQVLLLGADLDLIRPVTVFP